MAEQEEIDIAEPKLSPVENTTQSRNKKKSSCKSKMSSGELDEQTEKHDALSDDVLKQVKSYNKFFKSRLWIAPEEELTESEISEKRATLKKIVLLANKRDQLAFLTKHFPTNDESAGVSEVGMDGSEGCKGNANDSTVYSHRSIISSSQVESGNGENRHCHDIGGNGAATSPSKSCSSNDIEMNENDTEEQEFNCDNVQESSVSVSDHEDITNEVNKEDVTEQRGSDAGIVMDQISNLSKKTVKIDFVDPIHCENRSPRSSVKTKNLDSPDIEKISDRSRAHKNRQESGTHKISLSPNSIKQRQTRKKSTKTSKGNGRKFDEGTVCDVIIEGPVHPKTTGDRIEGTSNSENMKGLQCDLNSANHIFQSSENNSETEVLELSHFESKSVINTGGTHSSEILSNPRKKTKLQNDDSHVDQNRKKSDAPKILKTVKHEKQIKKKSIKTSKMVGGKFDKGRATKGNINDRIHPEPTEEMGNVDYDNTKGLKSNDSSDGSDKNDSLPLTTTKVRYVETALQPTITSKMIGDKFSQGTVSEVDIEVVIHPESNDEVSNNDSERKKRLRANLHSDDSVKNSDSLPKKISYDSYMRKYYKSTHSDSNHNGALVDADCLPGKTKGTLQKKKLCRPSYSKSLDEDVGKHSFIENEDEVREKNAILGSNTRGGVSNQKRGKSKTNKKDFSKRIKETVPESTVCTIEKDLFKEATSTTPRVISHNNNDLGGVSKNRRNSCRHHSGDSSSPSIRNDAPDVADLLPESGSVSADSTIDDCLIERTTVASKNISRFDQKRPCRSLCPGPDENVNMDENGADVLVRSSQDKTLSMKKRKLQLYLENGGPKRVEERLSSTVNVREKNLLKKNSISACTTPDAISGNCGGVKIESRVNVSTPLLGKKSRRKSGSQPVDLIERRILKKPVRLGTTIPVMTNSTVHDDGFVENRGFDSTRTPRAEVNQTLPRKKTQSPETSNQTLRKSRKGSLLEHPPAPSRQLNEASTVRFAPSSRYSTKQQNMRVNAAISSSSSNIINQLGLSPRHIGSQENCVEETKSFENSYSPSLDYDYVPSSSFYPQFTRQSANSHQSSTKASPASRIVGQQMFYNSSEDSSSEYETSSAAQNRGLPLNYDKGQSNLNENCLSQTSEVSIYGDFYPEPVDLLRGVPNPRILVEKRHQSCIKDPNHKLDPSDMYRCAAKIDKDMPSFSPKPSCIDEDEDEWKKYHVNWDEPTYFDGENSFGVFYNDASSNHKAMEWTNKLHKMLKTTPVSILKKKPSIERHIKSTARQVRLFDILGTSPSLALSQSTVRIIKDSICPQYWNEETCDKTCKKKHKMNCDEFPSVSSGEVFQMVSARLMEMEKPPLEMVSSFIEWLAAHEENIKLLSFSKILLINKGLSLCTAICSLLIKNMAKHLGWQPESVVEYLLKFHYFMNKNQRSKIVPVLNKLIEYCQVGKYKHKVYAIICFVLDIEGYCLPFAILDKLIHEVNNNPPEDIMETKEKIKNQLKSFEKCNDQAFRARAYTFLRTYFPESYP